MSSKWAHLRGKYPAKPAEASFEERVAARTAGYVDYSIPSLADEFVDLKQWKSGVEEQVEELNVVLEALQRVLLEKLEAQGLSSAETSSGQKLNTKVEVYPHVVDGEAFSGYLKANPDLDYIRKPHPASLAAYVRGLLEEGKDSEVPPGVSVYLKTTVGVKKA